MNIKQLRGSLEEVIGREIQYRSFKSNEKLRWVGEMVEKELKRISSEYPNCRIGDYSPFQYNDLDNLESGLATFRGNKIPTWQTIVWQKFLNKSGELDFSSFQNSVLLINKPKKVGNTYLMAHLVPALLLTNQISHSIAGAANMQWLTNFFLPAMRKVFPELSPNAARSKEGRIVSYTSTDKTFFINESELKVVGMDSQKRKMKGHKAKLAFLDETASIKNYELIYETLLNPVLRTRGGMILGGTPDPDCGRWFDEIFKSAENKQGVYANLNVHTLKFDIYQSGMWDEKRIDEMMLLEWQGLKSLYPNIPEEQLLFRLAQENFNYFTTRAGTGPEHYTFIKNKNEIIFPSAATPDIGNSDKWTIITSTDHGESIYDAMAITFWAYDNDATYLIFDEWQEYDANIARCVDNIYGTLAKWNINQELVTHYLDSKSGGRNYKSIEGASHKLYDRFLAAGIEMKPASAIPIVDRINLLQSMFEIQPGLYNIFTKRPGSPQILISDCCWQLLKELEGLELDWSGTTRPLASQLREQKANHLNDTVLQLVPYLYHTQVDVSQYKGPIGESTMADTRKKWLLDQKRKEGFKII